MEIRSLHASLVRDLRMLRRPDGGFGTSTGGIPEIEATAVVLLAIGDPQSRSWLAKRQMADGGFEELDGRVGGPATAALAALALGNTKAGRRALQFAIARRGLPRPDTTVAPGRRGWGWTSDTRSTVEPTSRVLLAVNALTPSNNGVRREAIRLLEERHCADGGWNFGNASVNDVDLRGYSQTTAIALTALQGGPRSLVGPGLAFLRTHWRGEPGGMTAAQSLLAFRVHGVLDEARRAVDAIAALARRPSFREAPLTVAWCALATAEEQAVGRLRSRA